MRPYLLATVMILCASSVLLASARRQILRFSRGKAIESSDSRFSLAARTG